MRSFERALPLAAEERGLTPIHLSTSYEGLSPFLSYWVNFGMTRVKLLKVITCISLPYSTVFQLEKAYLYMQEGCFHTIYSVQP